MATPPHSICVAVDASASDGVGSLVIENEPVAHIAAANSTVATPIAVAPLGVPGSSSTATPPKPTSTPISVPFGTRSRKTRRKTITHMGSEAMSSAARPEGTPAFSPTDTRPLPPSMSRTPTTAAPASCRHDMCSAERPRRSSSHAASAPPATLKRSPELSSGGIVETIARMAK